MRAPAAKRIVTEFVSDRVSVVLRNSLGSELLVLDYFDFEVPPVLYSIHDTNTEVLVFSDAATKKCTAHFGVVR